MKLTTKVLGTVLGLALLTYAISPGVQLLRGDSSAWGWRNQIINLSGVIAFYLMTTTVWLSLRASWVDRRIGLDRAYQLHRHVGIAAAVAAVFHWAIRQVPRWLVQLGLVANPGDRAQGDYSRLEKILYKTGLLFVEYAFYAAIVLVIVALVQRIPYRIFRKMHKLLPGVFVIIAYHAATAQLRDRWTTTPAGYVVIAIAVAAAASAVVALAQRIGASRRVKGVVASVDRHGALVDITVDLQGGALAHEPGQFAFLRFPHDPEPHPFTIAGSEARGGSLRFVVKALGDFTHDLGAAVRVGQPVEIEGPYGAFRFDRTARREVWIAGGIGITPFLEQLGALAMRGPDARAIDFWYCTTTEAEGGFPADLDQLCARGGIRLHRMVAERGARLTASLLRDQLGALDDVAIWFCGPAGFARDLTAGLASSGFDVRKSFHREEFRFR